MKYIKISHELEVNLSALSCCHGLCHKFITEQLVLLHGTVMIQHSTSKTKLGTSLRALLLTLCKVYWKVIRLHEKVKNMEMTAWGRVGA